MIRESSNESDPRLILDLNYRLFRVNVKKSRLREIQITDVAVQDSDLGVTPACLLLNIEPGVQWPELLFFIRISNYQDILIILETQEVV